MKLLTKASAMLDDIIGIPAVLVALVLIFLTLGITASIVMRYFASNALGWMMEISEYALLWVTFLGAAWVLRREGHVKIGIVLTRLKPSTQTLLNFTTSIIGTIACSVLTWYAVEFTWLNFQEGYRFNTELAPSKFIVIAIIPIGSFLLSIQFLRRTFGYFIRLRASPEKEQPLQ